MTGHACPMLPPPRRGAALVVRHSCLSAPLPQQETSSLRERASPGRKSVGRRILLRAVPSIDSAAGLLLEVPRPCAFWAGQPPFSLPGSAGHRVRGASALGWLDADCVKVPVWQL